MPLLPTLRLRDIRSVYERVCDFFCPAERRRARARQSRRLQLDPLEERMLLSIYSNTVSADATTLTIDTGGDAVTVSAKSIATDDNGDAVVVWTATETVWDEDRGEEIEDYNVYAKYLTHNVQNITLAEFPGATAGATGVTSFYLLYGDNSITQTLKFKATKEPGSSADENISAQIRLTFGAQSAGPLFYNELDYNTFASDLALALQSMGGQLTNAEVTATDAHTFNIKYQAASSPTQTYLAVDQDNISFSSGYLPSVQITVADEPVVIGKIRVYDPTGPDPFGGDWSSFDWSNFDWTKVATSIQSYMEGKTEETGQQAPVEVNLSAEYTEDVQTGLDVTVAYVEGSFEQANRPTFRVTFNGDTGYLDLDKLQVVNAINSVGDDVSSQCSTQIIKQSSDKFQVNPFEADDPYTFGLDVSDQGIYKYTIQTFEQSYADLSVAMDGDGEFIITWTNWNDDGTSDIVARRFEAQSYVADTDLCWHYRSYVPYEESGPVLTTVDTPVQGVRPIAAPTSATSTLALVDDVLETQDSTFIVNTLTTGIHAQATVAVNSAGRFVISWNSEAQYESFFNSVYVREFTADGKPVDIEWRVSKDEPFLVTDTDNNLDSYVALSDNGTVVVAWTTYDPKLIDYDGFSDFLQFKVADWEVSDWDALAPIQVDGGAFSPSIAFAKRDTDGDEQFIVTWESVDEDNDPIEDNLDGIGYITADVFASAYQYNAGNGTLRQLLDKFLVNTEILNNTDTFWVAHQGGGSVGIDADGDITISYDGMGPDVSETVDVLALEYYSLFDSATSYLTSDPTLLDDLDSWGISLDDVFSWFANADNFTSGDVNDEGRDFSLIGGDVDDTINAILLQAQADLIASPLHPDEATVDELLGRISGLLENNAGLLRGEANGILYTQIDANVADAGDYDASAIDIASAVANPLRDGSNTAWLVMFDYTATQATIPLTIFSPYNTSANITFSAVYVQDTQVLDVQKTINALNNAFQGAEAVFGDAWPTLAEDPNYLSEGSIDVRWIDDDEIRARAGTDWEVKDSQGTPVAPSTYWVFEVTMQGSAHDAPYLVQLNPDEPPTLITASSAEVQRLHFDIAGAGQIILREGNVPLGYSTTDAINIDTANPSGTAAAIQTALNHAHPQLGNGSDITVIAVGGSGLEYEVRFGGTLNGIDFDELQRLDVPYPPNTDNPNYKGLVWATTLVDGGSAGLLDLVVWNMGDSGTKQYAAALGMQSNGTFVIAYTQENQYTDTSRPYVGESVDYDSASFRYYYSTSIEVRTFEDSTDTAGPEVTAVDYLSNGVETQILTENAVAISSGFTYLILDVNEALLCAPDVNTQLARLGYADPDAAPEAVKHACQVKWDTSVLNPACYSIALNDTTLYNLVVDVHYGLNQAASMVQYLRFSAAGSGDIQLAVNGTSTQVFRIDTADSVTTAASIQTQLTAILGEGVAVDVVNGADGLEYTVTFAGPLSKSTIRDILQVPLAGPDAYTGTVTSARLGANKYQIVLVLDSDPTTSVLEPLEPGNYTVTVHRYVAPSSSAVAVAGVCDLAGNTLNLTGFNASSSGADFAFDFELSTSTSGADMPGDPTGSQDKLIDEHVIETQNSPAVASAADGSYVVVWFSDITVLYVDSGGNPLPDTAVVAGTIGNIGDALGNIIGQRYDATGKAIGPEFMVNSGRPVTFDATTRSYHLVVESDADVANVAGRQFDPAVSMNDNGDFVVVWSGAGSSTELGTGEGVFARTYNNRGQPTVSQFIVGNEFLIQSSTISSESPAVAMANDGTFSVTWTEYDSSTRETHVYACRYTSLGTMIGSESQVDGGGSDGNRNPDIASDNNGNFVVVWEYATTCSSAWDIHGQLYDASGNKVGSEFVVNAYTNNVQEKPAVSTDGAGNFVVSWLSLVGTSTSSTWGIYARRFNSAGVALSGDIQVDSKNHPNLLSDGSLTLDVACAPDGDFTVVWTTYGQDDSIAEDMGVYARMYLNGGGDYVDSTGQAPKDFRVNSVTAGNQVTPAVTRNAANGDAVVVWVGPGPLLTDGTGVLIFTGTDIYARVLDPPEEIASVAQGPAIANVVAATAGNKATVTWSATGTHGIASATLTIDGAAAAVAKISGSDLSARYVGSRSLSVGSHAYTITVIDSRGVSATYGGTVTIAGSTISNVVVNMAASTPVITWKAADSDGVKAVKLTIDDVTKTVSKSGSKYARNCKSKLGSLWAGDHTYVITVTDTKGVVTTATGTFTVAASTVSNIAANMSAVKPTITWSVADGDRIRSVALTIDGVRKSVTKLKGSTKTLANYSGKLGTLTDGTHTYVIKVTDAKGFITTYSGTFTVVSATTVAAAVASSSLGGSAKTNWLIDFGESVTTSTTNQSSVDAVFASY